MNESNRRLFITIGLCLLATYAWGHFFGPKPKTAAELAAQTAAGPAVPGEAAKPAEAKDVPRGTTTPLPAGVPAAAGALTVRPPSQTLVLESEKLRLELSTDGAALKSVQLKGPKFAHKKEPKAAPSPLDLVDAGLPLLLSTELKTGETVVFPADTGFSVVQSDGMSATLRGEAGGLLVTKTLTLSPTTYKVDVQVEVQSTGAFAGQLTTSMAGNGGTGSTGSFLSPASSTAPQTICRVGKDTERLQVGAKHPTWTGTAASFAGISHPYFLIALATLPASGPSGCQLDAKGSTLLAGITSQVVLAPGATEKRSYIGYLGPKDTDELAAVAPALKDAVDLGFWSVIASFLLAVMKLFYKLVPPHNWGIAIILLTLSVKLVTFPLQHKSMKSMQEMSRIQPLLDELKKKYAGDQQRMNAAQMELFKEHGVNPMGSCLPLLIQMPVWFALYSALQNSVELYNSVFIPGWLEDLTAKDPYYVLPVAMGITMLVTQILTPTPTSNPSQKYIGYAMSGFFSLLMLSLPSGLTLYIFTNNLLSILQQIYLRRTMRPLPSAAAGATVAVTARQV